VDGGSCDIDHAQPGDAGALDGGGQADAPDARVSHAHADGGAKPDAGVTPHDAQMPPDAQEVDGAPMMCLVDGDRDGFGALALCPPDGEEPGLQPKDCDDGDADAYPGAPIVRCDGVDNDCDGDDEGKIDEVCNGADDDCDGRVDFGLVSPTSTAVITRPGSTTAQVDVSLVRREGGGGWLLALPNDGSAAESIVYRSVDANGKVSGDVSQRGTLPDKARKFVADSDGKWLAVLSARRPRADDSQLQLQLFRAGDLTLAGQVDVVTHADDDGLPNDRNDPDDCDSVAPFDVAVYTDVDGQVWVAMQFVDRIGQPAQSSCTSLANPLLQVAVFNEQGSAPALHKSSALKNSISGQLARIPCRPEWLVLDGDTPQRFDLKGSALGEPLEKIPGATRIWSMAATPEQCTSAKHDMAVVYMREETLGRSPGLVRQFRIETADGSFARLGNDIELDGDMSQGAAIYPAQGRWFVAGWFHYPNYSARLWEVATSDAVVPRRELTLPSAIPGYAGGNAAVLATDGGFVVAYQNANGGSLANARDAGDTDPAIAVLYSLACP
jgi:hypothetical protein